MITVADLTKRFGAFTAVDNLGFQVDSRQALALWGPNGAGKTTVIKCLLDLLRYDGHIQVDGLDAHRQGKAVRHLVGYVPQELSFYPDMNTLETARFYARLKEAPAGRAEAVLGEVGLSEHASKPVGALSGGMKQRLALGLALLTDPPVLVLDEPTSNLDAAARYQFLHLLAGVKAVGKTILFTSHRLEEVEALADQALVMDRGQMRVLCPAAELPERLGLRTQVRLRVPPALLDQAMAALQAGGFTAARNGTGVLVDVPPDRKALPIAALSDAGIPVVDFEIQ
jgi:ABC-2 type transport system ATP-binding protein/nitrous oxidase accessory protein